MDAFQIFFSSLYYSIKYTNNFISKFDETAGIISKLVVMVGENLNIYICRYIYVFTRISSEFFFNMIGKTNYYERAK